MAKYKLFSFNSGKNSLVGKLVEPEGYLIPAGYVLFLHGGGEAGRDRFAQWQEYLAKYGFASFAFNFRGVGDSEGNFEDGSLNNRLVDAENALLWFQKNNNFELNKFVVVGTSMGAHVAVRLIEKYPTVSKIICAAAAAYGVETENQKLNSSFTITVRKENSWKSTKLFSILRNYLGKVCVVYGALDAVIPDGVKDEYKNIASQKGTYIELLGVAHKILSPQTPDGIAGREKMYRETEIFMQSISLVY